MKIPQLHQLFNDECESEIGFALCSTIGVPSAIVVLGQKAYFG